MTVPLPNTRPTIEPLGDQALLIILGAVVDPDVNRRVCALAARVASMRSGGLLSEVLDVVPSFATVAVHYRADAVACGRAESPYDAVARQLSAVIDVSSGDRVASGSGSIVVIPVCYGGDFGPDLEDAAAQCGLSVRRLIELHSQSDPLRVYMIGFAPGAPYIGLLDERLSLPRRPTPRISVPAGTVAIANRQSVIYPVAGPGGWSLIGRTPFTLFDMARAEPSLLEPGTLVRFEAMSRDEFEAWTPPWP